MTKDLKHINKKLLLDVFGDDHEIICDMVEVFVSMAKEYHKEIKVAYESENWFELGLVTHKAKASCRTMGLSKLGDALDKVENNAKGIAYTQLDESRELSEDNEKLYKAMLREGQKSGDTKIIDREIKYFLDNFEEALVEILYLKTNIKTII